MLHTTTSIVNIVMKCNVIHTLKFHGMIHALECHSTIPRMRSRLIEECVNKFPQNVIYTYFNQRQKLSLMKNTHYMTINSLTHVGI